MSALYENLIEVQGIDGTEDRGQVARLKKSLTLTVEVAAALDATSDSDQATTGATLVGSQIGVVVLGPIAIE